jgi:hypothetical protein
MSEAINNKTDAHLAKAIELARAGFRWMSPAEADDILSNHNPNNRNIRRTVVQKYLLDVISAQWMVTGQPVIRDWNGNLLDGQHRLMAVRDGGVPVYLLVVEGIDPDVMWAIDKNAPRQTRDTLKWAGFDRTSERQAVIGPLWALDSGENLGNTIKQGQLNDHQRLQVNDRFDKCMVDGLPIAERLYKSRGLGKKGWGTAIVWMLDQGADRELLGEFADAVVTGVNLAADDPRYQLRNWCERARGIGGQKRTLRADELLIAVLKAWNYWVTGKKVKTFAIKPTEPIPAVEAGA